MRYRLTGNLESGGLSELYAAMADERFPVVVKLFFPHTSERAYAKEAVQTAQKINAISSPGLVRVREVGFVKGRLGVVREHVDGVLLDQILPRLEKREAFLSPALCFSLVIESLDLVQRAHDVGVLHGSLTPGNLSMTHAGTVAVCDFGVLQALRAVPSLAKLFTQGGRSVYRAPEVAQGQPPDPTSDVYSLGAIAYQLLTQKEPRPEGNDPKRQAVPAPSKFDRRLSSRIDTIIGRSLDPSPGRRYSSCADFAAALRELLAVSGGAVGTEERIRLVRGAQPMAPLGTVPFAEAFDLTEAVRLEVSERRAESATPPPRGSFSPSYRVGGAAALHPDGRPGDDETDPEPTAATEPAWEAPPGVVTGLRKRLLGQATASRPLKLKWVQDASSPLPALASVAADEVSASSGPAAVVPVHFPRRVTDTVVQAAPEPMPQHASGSLGFKRGALGLGLGLVASLLAAFIVGRWSSPAPQTVLESELGWDVPPAGHLAGFVAVRSNLPARVYVDGKLVRQAAPLSHYPVRPGAHRLLLESIGTGERRALDLVVVRGNEHRVEVAFDGEKVGQP